MFPVYVLIISTDKENHFLPNSNDVCILQTGYICLESVSNNLQAFFHLPLSCQHQGLANKMFIPPLFF